MLCGVLCGVLCGFTLRSLGAGRFLSSGLLPRRLVARSLLACGFLASHKLHLRRLSARRFVLAGGFLSGRLGTRGFFSRSFFSRRFRSRRFRACRFRACRFGPSPLRLGGFGPRGFHLGDLVALELRACGLRLGLAARLLALLFERQLCLLLGLSLLAFEALGLGWVVLRVHSHRRVSRA